MIRGEQIIDLLDAKEPMQDVVVNGWARSIRGSKTIAFIVLNDGTSFDNLQVVVDSDIDGFDAIVKAGTGAAFQVRGVLQESQGKGQKWEMKATEVTVLGTSAEDYPLQKKRHSHEFLRTIAHLRPRTNTYGAVFRVRSVAAFAIHKFFNERRFVYVHTPIITGSDAEGAGQMFQVSTLDPEKLPRDEQGAVDYSKDFFGKQTSLTVSGQLEGETFAMAFSNIYTFGPTFRAENSHTTRHASEFWMIEPEMAFYDLQDTTELAEEFIRYVTKYVLDNCKPEMAFFDKWVEKGLLARLDDVCAASFGRVTYTEAIDLLEKADVDFEYPVKWGIDLQTEHERYLTEDVFKGPLFVTDYPRDIKAFYMKQNSDQRTVAAMDMLVPKVGEIIGGSQREDDLGKLTERIEEMKLDMSDYSWYLDLRRYGSAPHAGFGLGFERLIMYLTGMGNIRDVVPFPRTPGSADF
jgi:asparaginyl-tRNA synthetase